MINLYDYFCESLDDEDANSNLLGRTVSWEYTEAAAKNPNKKIGAGILMVILVAHSYCVGGDSSFEDLEAHYILF